MYEYPKEYLDLWNLLNYNRSIIIFKIYYCTGFNAKDFCSNLSKDTDSNLHYIIAENRIDIQIQLPNNNLYSIIDKGKKILRSELKLSYIFYLDRYGKYSNLYDDYSKIAFLEMEDKYELAVLDEFCNYFSDTLILLKYFHPFYYICSKKPIKDRKYLINIHKEVDTFDSFISIIPEKQIIQSLYSNILLQNDMFYYESFIDYHSDYLRLNFEDFVNICENTLSKFSFFKFNVNNNIYDNPRFKRAIESLNEIHGVYHSILQKHDKNIFVIGKCENNICKIMRI